MNLTKRTCPKIKNYIYQTKTNRRSSLLCLLSRTEVKKLFFLLQYTYNEHSPVFANGKCQVSEIRNNFKRCTGCYMVSYFSKICQRAGWISSKRETFNKSTENVPNEQSDGFNTSMDGENIEIEKNESQAKPKEQNTKPQSENQKLQPTIKTVIKSETKNN
ncbi:unnamed protein product [Mytilus coruscus]|uniref:MYND-type domain-containing protein n=1 Tax=Mytilus coruscus TaxID=42192 RepID=A0A6J8DCR6_MYTCO|nr:unnamed protein product [Mytilus coruscus]